MGSVARIVVVAVLALAGCRGEHQGPGTITEGRIPAADLAQRVATERAVQAALSPGAPAPEKQILFGDLHVHTTFSADAFMRSLPILQGEGAHPPADACDFARYCSALDFWSINDHAEAITPQHWQETKESIRQCNAVAGDPKNPDIVAFLGWEWTQVGATPETHYGHKNVILRDTADDRVPDAADQRAATSTLVGALRAAAAALAAPRSSRSSTGRTASATSTSAAYSSELLERRRSARTASTRASCPATATRRRQTPERPVREAGAVGLRRDRHPARHDVGLLHAARLRAGTSSSSGASTIPTGRR